MARIERPAGSDRTDGELSGGGEGSPWITVDELKQRLLVTEQELHEARVWVRRNFGIDDDPIFG